MLYKGLDTSLEYGINYYFMSYQKFKSDYIDIFTNVMWECEIHQELQILGTGDALHIENPKTSNPKIEAFLAECRRAFATTFFLLTDKPLKISVMFIRLNTKVSYVWKEWYLEDLFREMGFEKLYPYFEKDPVFVIQSLQTLMNENEKAAELLNFVY